MHFFDNYPLLLLLDLRLQQSCSPGKLLCLYKATELKKSSTSEMLTNSRTDEVHRPLQKGGRRTPSVPSLSGSVASYPIYANVRTFR